jgi:RHS repeat-associated protein
MRYVHQDHLGSTSRTCPEPVEWVTDDTGAAVYEASCDPWGNVSASPGTADTDRPYTGQRFAAATGLYYYNARYGARPERSRRDPTLARFISPDTTFPGVSDPQAWNRYR